MPQPPAADEIELSVFGPGVGEAAAIHVGRGEWVLVDSCVDSRSGEAATLAYLRSLGLEPAECVKWVVATHAHDDHVEGLHDIVSACVTAQTVLPASSSAEEFLALVKLDQGLTFYSTRWTIYEEFRSVFAELELRDNFSSLSWVTAGKELPLGASIRGDSVRLVFLAPSDAAVTRSKKVFGRLLQAAIRPEVGGRIARRDPNSFSAAFVLHTGDVNLLLGGDVLRGSGDWGWRQIVASFPYTQAIDANKVAHHGAPNGYDANVWTLWAKPACVAIVTPYRPSGRPRLEDVERMGMHGRPVWQTARSTSIASSSEVRRTAAKVRQVTTADVREVGGRMGQVRLRWHHGSVNIEAFGPAFQAY